MQSIARDVRPLLRTKYLNTLWLGASGIAYHNDSSIMVKQFLVDRILY